MRFALFTTNLAGGGAEKALAKIGSGLAARGHAVEFIVAEDGGRYPYPPPAGCSFHALAARASHSWLGKRHLAWRLRQHLRTTPYDLLVSTLPFADEVAALARLPRHACRIANTLSAELARLPAAKAQRRQARYQSLYSGRPLVAVSSGVATDLQQNFAASARVIANPFDFAAIHRLAAAPSARPTASYILHVGRFASQKRHDVLFAAYALLEPYPHLHQPLPQLLLLTPPDAQLAAMIAACPPDRRPTSADFQANPYPWMAGAELLVLSSDHEGLPNVLIEALACGTRVVSTDCPSGPREILTGDLARWLVPCNDAPALAAAMTAALAAPRPTPEAVARALAPYSAEQALTAWEQLAQERAAQPSGAPR